MNKKFPLDKQHFLCYTSYHWGVGGLPEEYAVSVSPRLVLYGKGTILRKIVHFLGHISNSLFFVFLYSPDVALRACGHRAVRLGCFYLKKSLAKRDKMR